MKTARPNFQSNLNVLKFKFKNSFQISNFKLKIIFLFSFFYFLFSASPVSAQVSPSDIPKNLHTYTQNVMIEVASALTCQLAGIDPVNPTGQCLGVDKKNGKIGFFPSTNPGQIGGALGFTVNMIGVLYTPPASSFDYFNYLASNFGIAKPVYAQTTGFEAIKPLAKIWAVFRNITYLLFVVVFVLVGLAIMLRVKIDPRTVMSIENQIPKIIIALILVTFSFAIAGFLIDMMWLTIFLIVNIFSSADQAINPGLIANQLHVPTVGFVNEVFNPQNGGWGGVLTIAWNASGSLKDIIANLFRNTTGPSFEDTWNLVDPNKSSCGNNWLDVGCWLGQVIGGAVGGALSTILGGLLSWVIGTLAFLVIIIALLWALLKLWFALLKAFVFILIDIIFAPFWILTGFAPGGPGFTGWLRDIGANLLAFPTAIGMFLLGKLLMDAFNQTQADIVKFVPPLIGNPLGVGTTTGSVSPISSLIGLGFILMTPQVVAMMQDVLKAPQFKYTAAIGEAMGAGSSSLKNIASSTALGLKGSRRLEEKGLPAIFKKMLGL